MADGQTELLAAEKGDVGLLSGAVAGRALDSFTSLIQQNNSQGISERAQNHFDSIVVGHLSDPNDPKIVWAIEEKGTARPLRPALSARSARHPSRCLPVPPAIPAAVAAFLALDATVLADGHARSRRSRSMKRMLFNATQPEELRRGHRRRTETDRPRHRDRRPRTTQEQYLQGASSPASSRRSKPASSTTAKTATASCRSRKSPAATSATASTCAAARIQDAIREGQELHRPGREGRARQQGRGADHLHLAGRPLPGADAEQPARRRRLAPHRGRGPQELRETIDQLECPKGMSLIARTAGIGRSARRAAVGPELPAASCGAPSTAPSKSGKRRRS